MNVLFEFFILQELKNNKEIIDEEMNDENLFFDNEKLVYYLHMSINCFYDLYIFIFLEIIY